MSNRDSHIVDIGDDPNGILCKCLALGCGWSFRSEDRTERLHQAYKHVAEAVNASK